MIRPVTLVKLGGSLITDKECPETDRPEAIRQVAGEIASALPRLAGRLVVGHGSGSFGHVAAAESGIAEGLASRERLPGVSRTQAQAAELHRRIRGALVAAGVPAFSIAPSSAAVTAGGRCVALDVEPVRLALAAGLVPVVWGDVVMDRERGVSILSTEGVFAALAAEGALPIERVLWVGETEGVWDREGRVIPRVTPGDAERARAAVGGSAGTDVTGGMALRLEAALDLARRGIPSWIGDGRTPGRVAAVLAEEAGSEAATPGTRVVPD